MTVKAPEARTGESIAVLLVDDHEENLVALEAILAPLHMRMVSVRSGALALKALLREPFAAILLDVAMPDMDGFETAEIIKERDKTKHTPIIFMTAAIGDPRGAMRGYAVGAVDYLYKPLDAEIVRAKVAVFVELHRRGEQIQRQAELLLEAEARQRELEFEELRMRVERRYQRLGDAVPQLVLRVRQDGGVDYVNRRWVDFTGLDLEPSAGAGWRRALHPNDADRFLALWDHAVTAAEPFRGECRIRADNGGYRWFLCEGVPERDAPPTPLGLLASFTDVTEQKRGEEERATLLDRAHGARIELEAALRRSDLIADVAHRLSQSLDPGDVPRELATLVVERLATWCVVDRALPDGNFEQIAFAHASPDLAPLGADLARGGACTGDAGVPVVLRSGRADLGSTVDAASLARALCTDRVDVVSRLGAASFVSAPLRARGEVLGALTLVSAKADRVFGTADLALAIDLAQRAALCIDNARLYAEAQQAVRVREEFLAIASHELRTPLSALQLQIQSIDLNLKKPAPDMGRLVDKMVVAQRQVQRLTRLIDELLDVSRIQAGRLELDLDRADLTEIVNDVLARFHGEIERSAIQVELHAEAPVVGSFDRLRVDQVVTNLLHNAIKYGRGTPIRIEVVADAGLGRLRFTDHGIGISEVDAQRIFGRWERAVSSRSYGGMGIGLFIVDQIVRAHGGTIRVESVLGQGATFIVELPLQEPPSQTSADGAKERNGHMRSEPPPAIA